MTISHVFLLKETDMPLSVIAGKENKLFCIFGTYNMSFKIMILLSPSSLIANLTSPLPYDKTMLSSANFILIGYLKAS